MWLDLRIAARRLSRSPGFTVVSILLLGLGIGVSTAVFTLGRRVLFDSLPYRDPERLVHLWETTRDGRREASYPDFLAWKGTSAFEEMAGYTVWTLPLKVGDRRESLETGAVTASFFQALGVPMALGRGFQSADEGPGATPVVILSQALHTRLFGPSASLDGRTVLLGERACTVIGVLPSRFQLATAGAPQAWIPLPLSENRRTRGYWHWLNVVGRLAPGQTLASARAALAVVASRTSAADQTAHAGTGVTATPLRDEIIGPARPVLWPLALTAAAVLLLACASTGVGLLTRGLSRAHELAVRRALGAGDRRVAWELLAETVVLGVFGGLAGVGVATVLLPVLQRALPRVAGTRLPYLEDLSVDGRALGFAIAAALVTSLAAGLAPALASARQAWGARGRSPGSLAGGLHDSGRAHTARGSALRFGLVAAQAALTTVLLAGTALLGRSTVALLSVDTGFSPHRLLTLSVQLPPRLGNDALLPMHDRILDELRRLPGAVDAASVSKLPLSGGGDTGTPQVEGRAATRLEANMRTVSPGYFPALGLALLQGRGFGPEDRAGATPVAVVNRSLARALFGGASPLGQRLKFVFLDKPLTVVGVVADENVTAPDVPFTPVVYTPFAQDAGHFFSVVVRTSVAPDSLARAATARLQALDADLVLDGVSTMDRRLADSPSVAPRKTVASLMGLFAALALALSAVGVAHVLAWEASQRTREVGVRVALGARPAQIAGLFLADGLLPLAGGLAVGVVAALGAARFLTSFLYGVSPADPLSHALAAATLMGAGLLACAVPALQAARLDPAEALRAE